MDAELVQILLEIKADTAATKKAVEDLSGPQGRVTALEDQAKMQKWYSFAVVPALASIHAVLSHFGIKV